MVKNWWQAQIRATSKKTTATTCGMVIDTRGPVRPHRRPAHPADAARLRREVLVPGGPFTMGTSTEQWDAVLRASICTVSLSTSTDTGATSRSTEQQLLQPQDHFFHSPELSATRDHYVSTATTRPAQADAPVGGVGLQGIERQG
ncbi:hypothetical protein [Streptomyces sp. NPDC056663]|uniref:hypothetical protein n=1 Tax=Streptomyces sp. NPDC056663 TaxID=3345899 RepID=UPI0036B824F6